MVPMTEGIVDVAPPPEIEDRDRLKVTGIRDLKIIVDLGALEEIKIPLLGG
jgi:hypothetical protein